MIQVADETLFGHSWQHSSGDYCGEPCPAGDKMRNIPVPCSSADQLQAESKCSQIQLFLQSDKNAKVNFQHPRSQ